MRRSYTRVTSVREIKTTYSRPKLNTKITSADDVFKHLSEYKDLEREHFIEITLDGASRVINTRIISIGTLNQSLVHPREVFRPALLDNCAAIIVAHNHPSGQLTPSIEDKRITKRLKEVGTIVGVEVLDHVILAVDGYYSFREEGLI